MAIALLPILTAFGTVLAGKAIMEGLTADDGVDFGKVISGAIGMYTGLSGLGAFGQAANVASSSVSNLAPEATSGITDGFIDFGEAAGAAAGNVGDMAQNVSGMDFGNELVQSSMLESPINALTEVSNPMAQAGETLGQNTLQQALDSGAFSDMAMTGNDGLLQGNNLMQQTNPMAQMSDNQVFEHFKGDFSPNTFHEDFTGAYSATFDPEVNLTNQTQPTGYEINAAPKGVEGFGDYLSTLKGYAGDAFDFIQKNPKILGAGLQYLGAYQQKKLIEERIKELYKRQDQERKRRASTPTYGLLNLRQGVKANG